MALKFLQEFPDGVFHAIDVESLLGERRSLLSRPGYRFESSVTFDLTVGSPSNFYSWIALKFLQEFADAVFLVVDVESLLGGAEVSALETRVPVRRCRNF